MSVEFPERFNMSDYFLYHNVEGGRENKVCLYFEDERFTYGDAVRRSNRAGNALRELGLHTEDRVLIALPDCPEFVWTWFGASRAGGVVTMVNPLLPAADYKYYLEYTRARVAVIHESLLANFAEAAEDARHLRNVLVVGGEHGDFLPYAEVVAQEPDELAPADTHRDDIAIWLFTSGSTGHPKGAVHLHHDLPFNTECYAKRVLGVSENDLTVSVPKLFFGYATGTNLLFPFAVGGATALFSERSTPEKLF
ncbi:MAG: AMP-binding protein, partial [Acidobacteria bacterium]|nr:AMP-binding protein [Acidobacteriota bacterium]